MKKLLILTTLIMAVLLLITGCASSGNITAAKPEVLTITVTSTSIVDGKLLTTTAADKKPNHPLGGNQSPAVSWDAVENANYYAVIMFDESADWLHFLVTDITTTSIEEGKYTNTETYIGPYPPNSSGVHTYRIEVFAIKNQPSNPIGKLDSSETYRDIVNKLNRVGGNSSNILARGHIIGTYQNGDNTVGDSE